MTHLPKIKRNFLGRGTAPCPDPSQWKGDTPTVHQTLPKGARPSPSQNPKYATSHMQANYRMLQINVNHYRFFGIFSAMA